MIVEPISRVRGERPNPVFFGDHVASARFPPQVLAPLAARRLAIRSRAQSLGKLQDPVEDAKDIRATVLSEIF
jgi:hypothetical protein